MRVADVLFLKDRRSVAEKTIGFFRGDSNDKEGRFLVPTKEGLSFSLGLPYSILRPVCEGTCMNSYTFNDELVWSARFILMAFDLLNAIEAQTAVVPPADIEELAQEAADALEKLSCEI